MIWQNIQSLAATSAATKAVVVAKKEQKEEKRKVLYTVKSGDNLSFIAQRFRVTTKEIRQWNSDRLKKYLKPGQVLTLFVTVANRTI